MTISAVNTEADGLFMTTSYSKANDSRLIDFSSQKYPRANGKEFVISSFLRIVQRLIRAGLVIRGGVSDHPDEEKRVGVSEAHQFLASHQYSMRHGLFSTFEATRFIRATSESVGRQL